MGGMAWDGGSSGRGSKSQGAGSKWLSAYKGGHPWEGGWWFNESFFLRVGRFPSDQNKHESGFAMHWCLHVWIALLRQFAVEILAIDSRKQELRFCFQGKIPVAEGGIFALGWVTGCFQGFCAFKTSTLQKTILRFCVCREKHTFVIQNSSGDVMFQLRLSRWWPCSLQWKHMVRYSAGISSLGEVVLHVNPRPRPEEGPSHVSSCFSPDLHVVTHDCDQFLIGNIYKSELKISDVGQCSAPIELFLGQRSCSPDSFILGFKRLFCPFLSADTCEIRTYQFCVRGEHPVLCVKCLGLIFLFPNFRVV